ncbi:MAG TPA: response regulator [bacterium]|nr:response regulator [bacterium]
MNEETNNQKTILLVEDDIYIAEIYQKQLEMMGFKAFTAGKAEEALTILGKNTVDLIILDLLLPGMSGLQLLQLLKQDDRYKTIPVVIVSNLEGQEVREEGLSLGAEKFITKVTITPYDLVSVVKEVLAA